MAVVNVTQGSYGGGGRASGSNTSRVSSSGSGRSSIQSNQSGSAGGGSVSRSGNVQSGNIDYIARVLANQIGAGQMDARQRGNMQAGDALGPGGSIISQAGPNVSIGFGDPRTPRTPRDPRQPMGSQAVPRTPRTPRSSMDTGREPRTRAPVGSRRWEEQMAAQITPYPGPSRFRPEGEGRFGEPLRAVQPTGGSGLPFQGGQVGFDVGPEGGGQPVGYRQSAIDRATGNYLASGEGTYLLPATPNLTGRALADYRGPMVQRPMTQQERQDWYLRQLAASDVGP